MSFMGEDEIMDECEYEHEDSIFYDEKYSGDESYLDELQLQEQEEELGDELDGEEIFEELTDYDYDDAYGLDSIEDLLKHDFLSIGVNHHNQTIVFAACIVTDETDETYIWVLQQFLEAMNGRAPSSVITDGARAMKNAIEEVFPGTHHRLCVWHLLRNVTTNMCSPRFTSKFKDCMLEDYEISVFRSKWKTLVEKFGVEEKEWLNEIYEKRRSWATCYIRGKFFAGFRTTSRCEGLHSLIGKDTKPHYDLSEFIEHFQRMLGHMRFRKFYAEYESALEFQLCKLVLNPLRCVLLILAQGRWTKKTKESMSESSSFTSELQASSRLCILNECARMMSEVACATTERFHEARDLMLDLYSSYKVHDEGNTPSQPGLGGGANPKGHSGRKKPQRCSNCKKPGYNKTSYSKRNENPFSTQGSSAPQTDVSGQK
ncbi:hypothetical protein AHAS_Ahas20G0150100 [Arachis hypogaea]